MSGIKSGENGNNNKKPYDERAFTLRLPETFVVELDRIGKEQNLSRNALIVFAVAEFVGRWQISLHDAVTREEVLEAFAPIIEKIREMDATLEILNMED